LWVQLLSAPFAVREKTKANRYISFAISPAPRRGAYWHDPFKLDRFGCEYFLAVDEEATNEAQGKQSASPLKTIDAFTMEKDP
jgi:hypothetical protein